MVAIERSIFCHYRVCSYLNNFRDDTWINIGSDTVSNNSVISDRLHVENYLLPSDLHTIYIYILFEILFHTGDYQTLKSHQPGKHGDNSICCPSGGQFSVSGLSHDDVIKWKHFPCYWPSGGEFTVDRWIPHTKANDAELWRFLWSAPE